MEDEEGGGRSGRFILVDQIHLHLLICWCFQLPWVKSLMLITHIHKEWVIASSWQQEWWLYLNKGDASYFWTVLRQYRSVCVTSNCPTNWKLVLYVALALFLHYTHLVIWLFVNFSIFYCLFLEAISQFCCDYVQVVQAKGRISL